ncbi:MAG TPA: hypothetical protein VJ045_04345 [Hyphomicrobiaceae bacterium]|nr:hypothetical protein [Hyphomicrobiaceae bacterium]
MAGTKGMGAAALILALLTPAGAPAGAQELSEKSVRSFMEYAWSLTPQQYSRLDGSIIYVDKTKKDQVLVPVDVAREVIRVGRISAHAQVCNLAEDQVLNHRSLMKREQELKKWTDQQMLFINQLHLTTVMLLTGKIKLVEKDGDKEVIIDETKEPAQTCTDEQRQKVKELITAYVKSGPALASIERPPASAPASEPAKSPAPAGTAKK